MMDNWKEINTKTYNNSAKELAEYFRGIGSRVDDIDKAIKLANVSNPIVLEIGCGDGRDAKEILKKTSSYTGIDISSELIKIAKSYVPKGNFIVADAETFSYGENKYNIIFAFASLLHVDKVSLEKLLKTINRALKKDGILCISLKFESNYTKKIKEDKFGTRMFYFYNPTIIKSMITNLFKVEIQDGGFVTVGNTKWFEMYLRKI